jgi:stearoyl-CoA desaturase (Delta-9 desaturase)
MTVETNYPTTISKFSQESLARAILQLNPSSARAKRVVALVTIGVPAIGFAIAVYLMCSGRATALDYTLFAVFYAIQTFGIGIGFHRYVAHKSFKTSRFFEGVLMVTGSMALEGPLLFWVSTHRRHHRFSDEAGDPHSPNRHGAGFIEKLRGLWYAHIPWMFSDKESRVSAFAPDVMRDRHLYNYSRTYPIWALASLLLPAVLGFVIGGTVAAALSGFIIGGLARVLVANQAAWCVLGRSAT